MTNMISVILPTFNEKGNICELIDDIIENIKCDYEIIVVDDSSPDGTGEFVKERFKDNKCVKSFIRLNEKGLATAIRKGIEESKGDIILTMDTDFNHDPKLIPQMINFLEYYDLIIGSRFTMGGDMYSRFRYYCSFMYNFMIRVVLHTQIQDNLSGYFSIRRDKLYKLNFDDIFWGYGDYFCRLLFFAEKFNFSILAIPVVYKRRRYGQSKTSFVNTLLEYTKEMLILRFKHLEKW